MPKHRGVSEVDELRTGIGYSGVEWWRRPRGGEIYCIWLARADAMRRRAWAFLSANVPDLLGDEDGGAAPGRT